MPVSRFSGLEGRRGIVNQATRKLPRRRPTKSLIDRVLHLEGGFRPQKRRSVPKYFWNNAKLPMRSASGPARAIWPRLQVVELGRAIRYSEVAWSQDTNLRSTGDDFRVVTGLHRGQVIGPFLSGKLSVWERKPSPIHSSTSSVVAEISTGWHPMPSKALMRFSNSTTPRTCSAHDGSAGSPRKLTSVAQA